MPDLLEAELRRPDVHQDAVGELCLRVLHADVLTSLGRDTDPRLWDETVARLDELLGGPSKPAGGRSAAMHRLARRGH